MEFLSHFQKQLKDSWHWSTNPETWQNKEMSRVLLVKVLSPPEHLWYHRTSQQIQGNIWSSVLLINFKVQDSWLQKPSYTDSDSKLPNCSSELNQGHLFETFQTTCPIWHDFLASDEYRILQLSMLKRHREQQIWISRTPNQSNLSPALTVSNESIGIQTYLHYLIWHGR
jgi:hypothetical protein